jgi:hypothetical protein
MKTAKLASFFAKGSKLPGILALLLAGCFNLITVIPPKTAGNPLMEPFSVDVLIGKDTRTLARSVAGPDADRVKRDLHNIIQLVVVDTTGNIVAFDEVRRGSDAKNEAELRIESIPFGQKYYFLLLMGHWERDYAGDDLYKYTANPPTLLSAGLREQTVTMWLIVVDTAFSSGG